MQLVKFIALVGGFIFSLDIFETDSMCLCKSVCDYQLVLYLRHTYRAGLTYKQGRHVPRVRQLGTIFFFSMPY